MIKRSSILFLPRVFFVFLFGLFSFEAYSSVNNDSLVIINRIVIVGNSITKPHIIMREIVVEEGDTVRLGVLQKQLQTSKENLLNTSLFNFVSIDAVPDQTKGVMLFVKVTERWYLWPYPVFEVAERNINSWWQDKDFSRLDYGVKLVNENFRGRKEQLELLFSIGFDREMCFLYKIPYINNKQTFGMGFSAGVINNHEIAYSNQNSKLHYYKDNDDYLQKNLFSFVELYYRNGIYNFHEMRIRFDDFSFTDTVLSLNNRYSLNGDTKSKYFSFYYKFKADHRDYKSYPLSGYYWDLEFEQSGLGVMEKSLSAFYVHSSGRMYQKINSKWYWAVGLNSMIKAGNQNAFYLNQGMGYDNDIVRSYEYYVGNGQCFGIAKSNIKYELISRKDHAFNITGSEKFDKMHYSLYANLFVDAGYLYDNDFFDNNLIANDMLAAVGIGLDYVTYYDKVFRIEYSINKNNESGVFLHFIAPI